MKNRCYLCKNPARFLLERKERRLYHCDACGLEYVYPRNLTLFDKTGGKFFREYLREKGSYVEYFKNKVHFINKFALHSGRLLDIGSGAGLFLQIAKQNGWEVVGIEPSSVAAE